MRLSDLPLDQLHAYRGTNPRPADFDEYWERALAELRGVKPAVRLVPSDFESSLAECFDLYFTGVRSAEIHAKYLRPRGAKSPHAALLEFHGYSMSSGDWSSKLHWVAEGMSVLSMDCRGQGGLSEDSSSIKGTTLRGHIIRGIDDAPDNLLYRQIFLDTVQLARVAMELEEVDGKRIGATGGSQGGGVTLACSAPGPGGKLAAPIYPFLNDYPRGWGMGMTKD